MKMLKEYSAPEFSSERISLELVGNVMDSMGFPKEFKEEIVQKAVCQAICHNAVWDDELEAYRKMAQTYGSIDGRRPQDDDAFPEILLVGHMVSLKLVEEESSRYVMANLTPEAVDAAMAAADVSCEVPAMRTLLGDLAVGGVSFIEENDAVALDAFEVSIDDIKKVASML